MLPHIYRTTKLNYTKMLPQVVSGSFLHSSGKWVCSMNRNNGTGLWPKGIALFYTISHWSKDTVLLKMQLALKVKFKLFSTLHFALHLLSKIIQFYLYTIVLGEKYQPQTPEILISWCGLHFRGFVNVFVESCTSSLFTMLHRKDFTHQTLLAKG